MNVSGTRGILALASLALCTLATGASPPAVRSDAPPAERKDLPPLVFPVRVDSFCPNEYGCEFSRPWTARIEAAAPAEPGDPAATDAYEILPGDSLTFVTAALLVDSPGLAVLSAATPMRLIGLTAHRFIPFDGSARRMAVGMRQHRMASADSTGTGVTDSAGALVVAAIAGIGMDVLTDSVRVLAPGDSLYILETDSEGSSRVWNHGALGWVESPWCGDEAKLLRPTRSTWWVRLRNKVGVLGWVPIANANKDGCGFQEAPVMTIPWSEP